MSTFSYQNRPEFSGINIVGRFGVGFALVGLVTYMVCLVVLRNYFYFFGMSCAEKLNEYILSSSDYRLEMNYIYLCNLFARPSLKEIQNYPSFERSTRITSTKSIGAVVGEQSNRSSVWQLWDWSLHAKKLHNLLHTRPPLGHI